MTRSTNIQKTSGGSITVELPDEDDGSLVYFMWSAGKIKIGHTADIMRRWDELQVRSAVHVELLLTCEGGPDLELDFHRMFKADRLYGEWFGVSDTMRGFFKFVDDHRPTPFQGSIGDRLAALGGAR